MVNFSESEHLDALFQYGTPPHSWIHCPHFYTSESGTRQVYWWFPRAFKVNIVYCWCGDLFSIIITLVAALIKIVITIRVTGPPPFSWKCLVWIYKSLKNFCDLPVVVYSRYSMWFLHWFHVPLYKYKWKLGEKSQSGFWEDKKKFTLAKKIKVRVKCIFSKTFLSVIKQKTLLLLHFVRTVTAHFH